MVAEANTVASYLNKEHDAAHVVVVQVHNLMTKANCMGPAQIQLETHARLYINKKLQMVNYASKIMSKDTEQAETWLQLTSPRAVW